MSEDGQSNRQYKLRQGTIEDAAAVALVHHRARQEGYGSFVNAQLLNAISLAEREADWRRQLNEAFGLGRNICVAEAGETVIGFAVIGPDNARKADPTTALLDRIYVEPAHWGAGIGRMLAKECISWAKSHHYSQIKVWTFEANQRARRFYESLGFTSDGTTRTVDEFPPDVLYRLSLA
ncbi:MAG TPA: GNAT family N-acetyltransferase [Chroococcales cyanobacterium]